MVKLGTITPSGADVYSYAPDEDDMVQDLKLAAHLAHWGINMMQVGMVFSVEDWFVLLMSLYPLPKCRMLVLFVLVISCVLVGKAGHHHAKRC